MQYSDTNRDAAQQLSSMADVTFEPVCYTIDGHDYTGIAAGDKGKPLLIGLHGWLDNAASHVPMMRELAAHYRFVSIDMPGHGYSVHWSSFGGLGYPYHYSEMLVWLRELIALIANKNGLGDGQTKPVLVGHSLGGTVVTMFAGVLYDELDAAVLIESLGPLTHAPEIMPTKMRKAIKMQKKSIGGGLKVFPDLDAAIERRMQVKDPAWAINRDCVALLVSRGVKAVEGGYQWRSDTALMLPSPNRFSEAQVVSTIAQIQVPVLIIEGDQGLFPQLHGSDDRLNAFKAKTHKVLSGRHHLHMDEATATADTINAYVTDLYQ